MLSVFDFCLCFLLLEQGEMDISLELSILRTVITRTKYYYSDFHSYSDSYFTMHKLAVIHQHPDFYVDHIDIVLHTLDSTISFGTVRLLLEVPLTYSEFLAGDQIAVAVCFNISV